MPYIKAGFLSSIIMLCSSNSPKGESVTDNFSSLFIFSLDILTDLISEYSIDVSFNRPYLNEIVLLSNEILLLDIDFAYPKT